MEEAGVSWGSWGVPEGEGPPASRVPPPLGASSQGGQHHCNDLGPARALFDSLSPCLSLNLYPKSLCLSGARQTCRPNLNLPLSSKCQPLHSSLCKNGTISVFP